MAKMEPTRFYFTYFRGVVVSLNCVNPKEALPPSSILGAKEITTLPLNRLGGGIVEFKIFQLIPHSIGQQLNG